jgi:urease subunit gamma
LVRFAQQIGLTPDVPSSTIETSTNHFESVIEEPRSLNLSPQEIDKLYIYVVADLARKRQGRGLRLNYSEAVALISEAMLEGARDGKTVADCMELGKQVLSREQVMDGVPELLHLIQVEAMFPDGSKLVSCHDPIV